jgi:Protein of unknown function (DUF2587)
MTSQQHPEAAEPIERGELVDVSPPADRSDQVETVSEPAKVMRIGSMVKQLLEEVRSAPLDEASRERLAEIYERSIVELSAAFSPDLQDELHNLALPFKDGEVPSESELRIAKAQLVGWLEGLFHGIQATLFAQQLAARQQLEQMRQLPPGAMGQQGMQQDPAMPERPGTYL